MPAVIGVAPFFVLAPPRPQLRRAIFGEFVTIVRPTGGTAAALDHDADGLDPPRRYFAILTIWLALAMAVLDGAIANVALPTIAHDLSAEPASSIWIINAYQLAIVGALLPLAALGDKLGYKRVYLTGVTVFIAGSVACALSHTLLSLTVSRVFQGLGAAGIMSINTALLRFTYPQRMLGRGIGYNSLVVAAATALGPTIASAILAVSSWQWLFAVNAPIGVLTIIIGMRALPRTPPSHARIDLIAVLLNVAAFAGTIFGIEGMARGAGFGAGVVLAVGLSAGALLVSRELHLPAPMVPIDLLRGRLMRLSVLTSVASFAAQMLAFIALPFFLEDTLGRSAIQTGLLMTPWPAAVALAAPFAGRLADRHPAGILCGVGLFILGTGMVALALTPTGASDLNIIWRMALCGIGFGFFQSPNNRTLVSAAPRHRSGAVGGLMATARLLGQTGGATTLAILFHLGAPHPTQTALVVAGGVAFLAAVVSLQRLRPEASSV